MVRVYIVGLYVLVREIIFFSGVSPNEISAVNIQENIELRNLSVAIFAFSIGKCSIMIYEDTIYSTWIWL